jgi:hypothetical protein
LEMVLGFRCLCAAAGCWEGEGGEKDHVDCLRVRVRARGAGRCIGLD